MKNKMQDVRDHLVARMEELGNEQIDEKALKSSVERSKATVALADQYIASVKVEIDARKALQGTNVGLPPALEASPIQDDKPPVRLIGGKGK